MKQLTPYIFPAVAILIVVVLVFRWYRLNTQTPGSLPDFGEQVQVEDVNEAQASILNGAEDFSSVPMQVGEEVEGTGEIRYEQVEDRVVFSVTADLPELETGEYQVWLRDISGQSVKPVYTLSMSKGGYRGTASFSSSALPIEVVVSQETEPATQPTEILLRGIIPQEEVAE